MGSRDKDQTFGRVDAGPAMNSRFDYVSGASPYEVCNKVDSHDDKIVLGAHRMSAVRDGEEVVV